MKTQIQLLEYCHFSMGSSNNKNTFLSDQLFNKQRVTKFSFSKELC